MIKNFDCKETLGIWHGWVSKKLPREMQDAARRKLVHLNSAESLQDLNASPGNKLEKLTGVYERYNSIRINLEWKLVFIWNDGMAHDVKIIKS